MKINHSETNINDEYHFKEIDTYMKEYWKTHTAIPPYEDDPPYIVARIIEKIKKENLTMKENLTKITIENYCDETIIFTMPVDSIIEINKIYSNSFNEDFYIEELKITATGIINEE